MYFAETDETDLAPVNIEEMTHFEVWVPLDGVIEYAESYFDYIKCLKGLNEKQMLCVVQV